MPAGRVGVTSGEIFFPPGLGPRAKFFSPQWGGEIFFSRASAGGKIFFLPVLEARGNFFLPPPGGRNFFSRASTGGNFFFPPGLGPGEIFSSPMGGRKFFFPGLSRGQKSFLPRAWASGEIFFSRASAGGEFFFSPPSGLDPGENFSSPTGGRKIFPRASAGGGNGRPPPGLLRLPRGRDFPRWSYHQAPGRLPLGQERSLGGGKFIFPPRTGRPISRPISISPLPLSGGGPGHPSAQGSGRLCEPGPPGESGQSLGGRGFIQTGVTQGFPRGGVPPAGFFQGFG
jgi:hypothetical protein